MLTTDFRAYYVKRFLKGYIRETNYVLLKAQICLFRRGLPRERSCEVWLKLGHRYRRVVIYSKLYIKYIKEISHDPCRSCFMTDKFRFSYCSFLPVLKKVI